MENYLPERGWKRVLVLAAYILLGAAAGYLALRLFLKPLLPFLAAWLLSLPVRKAAELICRRFKAPKRKPLFRLICAALLFCGVTLISALIYFAAGALASQASGLIAALTEESGDIFTALGDFLSALAARFGLPDNIAGQSGYAGTVLAGLARGLLASAAEAATGLLGKTAASLPGILLFAGVTLIAAFWFSADGFDPAAALRRLLPDSISPKLETIAVRLRLALHKYLTAYALLTALSFAVLFAGLLLLRVDFAFSLAVCIALIDALPLIGAGAALLPWSVFAFITGSPGRGFGLLVLFAALTVIRQLAEPKLLGKASGLHPLAALAAMYCGGCIFGAAGMLLFPFAAVLAGNVFFTDSAG